MTVMSMVGRGMIQMILVLGISWGIGGSRIPRSAVIAMKENTYISASKAIGLKTGRTLFRYILPRRPVLKYHFQKHILPAVHWFADS